MRPAARVAEQVTQQRTRALRESEERFRDISSNVPGVVYQFKIDAAGRLSFAYVSATIMNILGLAAEEVMRDATASPRYHATPIRNAIPPSFLTDG